MHVLAIAAVVGFAAIACFQAALALGAPLGRAAWGGTNARLPARLRVASLVSAAVWVVAAFTILGRTGCRASPVPSGFARWAAYVLVGVLALSAIMNTASRSKWERFLTRNGDLSTVCSPHSADRVGEMVVSEPMGYTRARRTGRDRLEVCRSRLVRGASLGRLR